MIVLDQYWEWIQKPVAPLELIELAGRTCYKSEAKITPGSAINFVDKILQSGHHSVIEHAFASVKFITDRGVTHELVRHRLCSFSQESTRYCNYGSDHIQFIRPVWMQEWAVGRYDSSGELSDNLDGGSRLCLSFFLEAESYYQSLVNDYKWRPEQARSVLPNGLKTEIIVTANLREWMHIFKLRCSSKAHPQIRELMLSCLEGFKKEVPVLFNDLP